MVIVLIQLYNFLTKKRIHHFGGSNALFNLLNPQASTSVGGKTLQSFYLGSLPAMRPARMCLDRKSTKYSSARLLSETFCFHMISAASFSHPALFRDLQN